MTRSKALFALHLTVFVWGFTGILGNEISLDAPELVWWRVFIATITIGTYLFFKKIEWRLTWREAVLYAIVGLLTAAHWIFFFGSIKASNVSTALAVISTTSFFVALTSPLIRKTRYSKLELLLGVLVIVGLSIIFRFEPNKQLGIIMSLMAALLAAVFSGINSVLVKSYSPVKMAFYEMAFAFAGLTLFLLIKGTGWSSIVEIGSRDLVLVIILGTVATGIAFIVSIDVMKVLTPFTVALAINLEPLYTILIALFLYGEKEYMSPQFYLGSAIILGTIFIENRIRRKD